MGLLVLCVCVCVCVCVRVCVCVCVFVQSKFSQTKGEYYGLIGWQRTTRWPLPPIKGSSLMTLFFVVCVSLLLPFLNLLEASGDDIVVL